MKKPSVRSGAAPLSNPSDAEHIQTMPVLQLMTAVEVAGVLRISVRTVRRMIASGQLPAIAIGRSIRIDPRAVSALIERK
jgi:excisionase family DNA binding protein